MRGVKSIRQLGVELAVVHETSDDYGRRSLTAYFGQLPPEWTLEQCKRCREKTPIPNPSAAQRIIIDAVAYYPGNLTVGDVLALGDAS